MQPLFHFLQRHITFFVFLLLESIAVTLLVQHNYLQRVAFAHVSNTVRGSIHAQTGKWRSYIALGEQNRQLREENVRLRNLIPQSYYQIDTTYTIQHDTTGRRHYAWKPARVINSTISRQHNYITIDRGASGGIRPGMAVAGPNGIAGIVYSVSKHFATIMPVINRNFRVSAWIAKNRHYGSLSWEGRDYRHAQLNEITLDVAVEIGDTVTVSGFADNFPEGLPVGTVTSIERKDGNFYAIDILLATDFRKLYDVMIVEDLMQNELQSIQPQNETP